MHLKYYIINVFKTKRTNANTDEATITCNVATMTGNVAIMTANVAIMTCITDTQYSYNGCRSLCQNLLHTPL